MNRVLFFSIFLPVYAVVVGVMSYFAVEPALAAVNVSKHPNHFRLSRQSRRRGTTALDAMKTPSTCRIPTTTAGITRQVGATKSASGTRARISTQPTMRLRSTAAHAQGAPSPFGITMACGNLSFASTTST